MPRVFSGIQPTNILHIGNYLGAIKNWVDMQDQHDCIFCVVDQHAMTVKYEPKEFSKNILNTAKTYLAFGIDPKKSTIFIQSAVPEHTELAWYLNTITKITELERMTQFKDKAKQHKENINVGLFGYPVLMAADILLYDTEVVPVGEDQLQHIELARTLAERFNNQFGETFVVPKGQIQKQGARVMSLDDPTKKMSKSSPNAGSYISLLDSPEIARKKIMRAVTDSGSEVKSGPDKPALTNLLTIYSLLSQKDIKDIEKNHAGHGYADFKKELADLVVDFLHDFQTIFNDIKDDEAKKVLTDGAKKAKILAEKKMLKVRSRLGLPN